jgi:hypothetical protein
MGQYATASDLASFMQTDVDTSTANLLLTLVSGQFDSEADTTFGTPVAVTHSEAGNGSRILIPPFRPVQSVTAVRIDGVSITDYTVIKSRVGFWKIYRISGFGTWIGTVNWTGFPPQLVEVDLTYGYTTVPDDVRAAVLATAANAYQQPTSAIIAENIDDYRTRYAAKGGGVQLTEYAQQIAANYRGMYVA